MHGGVSYKASDRHRAENLSDENPYECSRLNRGFRSTTWRYHELHEVNSNCQIAVLPLSWYKLKVKVQGKELVQGQ